MLLIPVTSDSRNERERRQLMSRFSTTVTVGTNENEDRLSAVSGRQRQWERTRTKTGYERFLDDRDSRNERERRQLMSRFSTTATVGTNVTADAYVD